MPKISTFLDKIRETRLWQYDIIRSIYCILIYRTYSHWKKAFHRVKLNSFVCIEGGFGLADRLRGYVSIYSICREYVVPFKIHHLHPFDLQHFLEPNIYDWNDKNVNNQKKNLPFKKVQFYSANSCTFDHFYIKKYLKENILNPSVEQLRIATNTDFVRNPKTFSLLFNELFRPTQLVQEQLNYYKEIIGDWGGGVNYISVSSRFAGLIGDFNENFNLVLPENERINLLNNCITQIEKLHQKYPDKKILVCSDSITLLNMAKKLEYVVVIEGKPVHISKSTDSNIETHLKTFVDFFMIAGAQKVFLLVGGKMYPSGFPRIAALSQNKPFEIIRF